MDTPKRKCVVLVNDKNTEILKLSESHPKATQGILNHLRTLREIHIKRKTVGDILANNTLKKCRMILTVRQLDSLLTWTRLYR